MDKVRSRFPGFERVSKPKAEVAPVLVFGITELSEPAFRMSGFPSPLIKELIVHFRGQRNHSSPVDRRICLVIYNHSHQQQSLC